MARLREGPTTVRFYQVAGSSPDIALTGILFKVVEQGSRACLLALDATHVKRLDEMLWRYPLDRFLPHGPWDGPDPQRQPVLITLQPDDCNGASVLVVAASRGVDKPEQFDMVVDFVDPREPVANARDRYRRYQTLGCVMEYWIQSPEGRWTQKESRQIEKKESSHS
ncbi:MAG: DNA polymerase III subunit chi [Magnetococcales bacterium]|nr:DNA polymerase III subunit chi [Magnetococcales bacterium]MBF0438686.1 DNA polymerase III subunit chi [Magnetococcales bacterium]